MKTRHMALRAAPLSLVLLVLSAAATVTAAAAPPPGRDFELVTPADKSNVDVLPFVRPSSSGDGVVFQSFGSFAAAPAPAGNQNTYLSRRRPSGWSTEPLSPAGPSDRPSQFGSFRGNQFFMFRDNLAMGLLTNSNVGAFAPLVPGEPTESRNLYVRDNRTRSYTLLTDRVGTYGGSPSEYVEQPNVAWASSDLEDVLIDTPNGQDHWHMGAVWFPGSPINGNGTFTGVYHWSPQDGLSLASIMPGGGIAASAEAASGPMISLYEDDHLFVDEVGGARNAISEDGSRIFFSSPHSLSAHGTGQLYVRKDHGTPEAETVQVSAPDSGVVTTPKAVQFQGATPDGSKVLFTTCAPLTSASTASEVPGRSSCRAGETFQGDFHESNNNSLYLFYVNEDGGDGELVDLTTGDGDGARVRGVVGTSDDLSRIYFVADGVLAAGAQDGFPNLYLWDENTGLTTLIVTLSRGYSHGQPDITDAANWLTRGHPQHDARVSPDGNFLAFTSYHADLDPTVTYDNTDPETLHPLKQAYHWEIGDAAPRCVSCAGDQEFPSVGSIANQRIPLAHLFLPVYPDWEKRNLLPDGRLYFETANNLLPQDVNGEIDVYEYDPATDAVTLMSNGRIATPANFAGATADGSDVFIRTAEGLVDWDIDSAKDIYDVRVESGDVLPDPPPPPGPCPEESCPAPPTQTVPGPGNVISPPTGRFFVARLGPVAQRNLVANGRIQARVTVPGPGRITVIGRGRAGGRRQVVIRGSKTVTRAGLTRVTVRLTRAGKRAVQRRGRLKVDLVLSFGSEQRTVSFTLRRPERERGN